MLPWYLQWLERFGLGLYYLGWGFFATTIASTVLAVVYAAAGFIYTGPGGTGLDIQVATAFALVFLFLWAVFWVIAFVLLEPVRAYRQMQRGELQ